MDGVAETLTSSIPGAAARSNTPIELKLVLGFEFDAENKLRMSTCGTVESIPG
jgi:hypothetical protein